MISDNDLHSLAIFLGSVAMILIVLYHFFEVNSQEESAPTEKGSRTTPSQPTAAAVKQSQATK
ncbi:Oligosaccaryltransferase-domain-containing protein [Xylaria digitata]|nr:Oligosaccaryltransferase-domain-containing protein [Xylaria digitata]